MEAKELAVETCDVAARENSQEDAQLGLVEGVVVSFSEEP